MIRKEVITGQRISRLNELLAECNKIEVALRQIVRIATYNHHDIKETRIHPHLLENLALLETHVKHTFETLHGFQIETPDWENTQVEKWEAYHDN